MPTNNLLVLKKVIFSLAIGWTALIGFLCLVNLSNLPSFGVSGADKYVHFTFHFVFTILWGYYSWLNQSNIELKKIRVIIFSSVSYGIIIEILQEVFTTTRHADILDVLANLTGATMAFFIFFLIKKNKSKTKTL
jgi:VanZ family protein